MNLMASTPTRKFVPPPLGDDELELPKFLRRTRKQQEAINEYNRTHPLPPVNFSGETQEKRREVDETRARMDAERDEEIKQQNASRAERRKLDDERRKRGDFVSSKQVPGTEWDPGTGRWVRPGAMSAAKFNRLLGEMPNEKAREILIEKYGAGHGASLGAHASDGAGDVPKDSKRGAPSMANGRAKTREAGAKPAGRVRVTAAPPAKEKPKGAAPSKPRRGGKPEVVAAVEALLTRPEGATLTEIGAAYGWKDHSASAFVSVNFRNAGRKTTKETIEGRGVVYHLEAKS